MKDTIPPETTIQVDPRVKRQGKVIEAPAQSSVIVGQNKNPRDEASRGTAKGFSEITKVGEGRGASMAPRCDSVSTERQGDGLEDKVRGAGNRRFPHDISSGVESVGGDCGWRASKLLSPLFVFCVLAPILVSVFYYGFFATSVYVSESRFVVRGPQLKTVLGVEAMFTGAMGLRAPDEALSIHDYVLSRDALRVLDSALDLRKLFGSDSIFFLSRFPWIDRDDSFEALYRYYLTKVSFVIVPDSGICVLSTSAYGKEDALRMNQILVEASERFVNDLSKQSRDDILRAAGEELKIAEDRATRAALSLTEFKKSHRIMDIERQSGLHLELAARLYDELIATRAQAEQIRDVSSLSPQLKALEKKAKILKEEMDSETGLVLGGDASLVAKSTDYERLMLNKGYTEKAWAAALAVMDSAKLDAHRKQMYVQRVVEPSMPDRSFEPRRLKSILEVAVMGVLLFLLLSAFSSGVREHQAR